VLKYYEREGQNNSMLYAVAKENKNNTTRDYFLIWNSIKTTL